MSSSDLDVLEINVSYLWLPVFLPNMRFGKALSCNLNDGKIFHATFVRTIRHRDAENQETKKFTSFIM
jgi:hypothetical protein